MSNKETLMDIETARIVAKTFNEVSRLQFLLNATEKTSRPTFRVEGIPMDTHAAKYHRATSVALPRDALILGLKSELKKARKTLKDL
jgi:hypothetical protein